MWILNLFFDSKGTTAQMLKGGSKTDMFNRPGVAGAVLQTAL